ncbi:MAG: hypothetical protein JWO22_2995 [Frankiales bacterium]|nr:hypothetical protein [Frankiales bacterium]
MKLAARLVTAALVAGSAAIGFVPVAHADSTTNLTPATSAWYQPNPTCPLPTGCLTGDSVPAPLPVDVPLSPYPAGTLHVGYTGAAANGSSQGQETARAYLGFPVSSVDGSVTAAALDVPLDTTQADGSLAPETSHIQACLVSATITSTEGSISTPPMVSCDAHAVVKYVATPSPHLHADLAPLLAGLLTTNGIALLPDASSVTSADAWQAVFSTPGRTDAAKTDPPVLKLTVVPSDVVSEPEVPVDVPTDVAVPPVSQPVVPGSVANIPDVTAPTVDVPAVQAPTVQQPQAAVTEPKTITVGYAYPIVWLLPLVFLIVVPLAVRALTTDLTPTDTP